MSTRRPTKKAATRVPAVKAKAPRTKPVTTRPATRERTASAAGDAPEGPTCWMLVSSAENFERSRARGFDMAGMKRRHARKAARVRPGDRVVFYLTGVQAFGGTAEVTSTAREEATPIWVSKKGDGELYPWRFSTRLECACPPQDYERAEPLVPHLRYPKKWPAPHWRLAFQGNVHVLPREDYEAIRLACRARERGRPRPPGSPVLESERPPRIPARLRRPS